MAEFLVLGKWLQVQCNELQTLATLEVIIQLRTHCPSNLSLPVVAQRKKSPIKNSNFFFVTYYMYVLLF